jgi:hypothetical protein
LLFLPLRVDFVPRLEKQPFSWRANGTDIRVDALNKHTFWVFGRKCLAVVRWRTSSDEKHISPYVRAAACALLSRGGASFLCALCVACVRLSKSCLFATDHNNISDSDHWRIDGIIRFTAVSEHNIKRENFQSRVLT